MNVQNLIDLEAHGGGLASIEEEPINQTETFLRDERDKTIAIQESDYGDETIMLIPREDQIDSGYRPAISTPL